ncbi:MAG: insulinase family protein [Bacteroidales bacterium]|nr:insulinase family protein [Bacteroidales bacterium]
MKRLHIITLVAAIALTAPASAYPLVFDLLFQTLFNAGAALALSSGNDDEEQIVPDDSKMTYGYLPCGLLYIIYPNQRPAYRANFYLIENIGSVVEDSTQRGMAHFIEHLAFHGSKNFPGEGMTETLERHGMQFGYDFNASTSYDQTMFYIRNADMIDGDAMVDTCLMILKDIAMDLTLADEAIEAERPIILEEWRTGQGMYTRLSEKMFPVLFHPRSRYCHPPIGDPEVLKTFEPQALRDFYAKWYTPSHQTLFVIGHVDPKQVEKQIKKLWKKEKKPKNEAVRYQATIWDPRQLTTEVITDPEFPGSQIDFWFRIPTPERGLARQSMRYFFESYVGWMAQRILSQRMLDRLYQEDSPWSNAKADLSSFYMVEDQDVFRLYSLYDRSRRDEALEMLISEAKRASELGIDQAELDMACEAMLSLADALPAAFDEKNNDDHFARLSQMITNTNAVPSMEVEQALYRDFVNVITVDIINQYLNTIIQPHNLTAIMVEKDNPTVWTSEQFKQRIDSLWQAIPVEKADVDTTYRRPLLSQEPVPGKIISVERDTVFNARHYRLSNGARVTACRQTVRNDQIDIRAVQRGGLSAVLDSGFVDGSYVDVMADIGGLGDFSALQLHRKLNGLQASIETNYAPYSELIVGESRVCELDTLMQLLYLRMTTAREDTTAFRNWLKTARAHLVDVQADPDKVFSDSIRTILYGPAHPYLRRVNQGDLDTLSCTHSLELFRQRMANPAAFDFIIMGNIDLDSIEPLIERYIGSLPGDGNAERAPFHRIDRLAVPGERTMRFSYPMPAAKSKVYIAYELHRPYTLEDELAITLLSGILQKIYIQTLRTDAQGTYGATVNSASGEVDGFHSLFISFDTNSDMAESLLDAARQAIEDIAEKGVDASLFEALHAYMLQDEYSATLQQSYPMAYFTHRYLYGDDHYAQRCEALERVTPQTIQQLARDLTNAPVRVALIMDAE